jgi:hypothetical protein
MTNRIFTLFTTLTGLALMACEDEIFPELPQAESVLVVDAFITNKPEDQVIQLTRSQPYFDNTFPPGVAGAQVEIVEGGGKVYSFMPGPTDGEYIWSPTAEEPTFGQVGKTYQLNVRIGGALYQASSAMNRVPEIDSIVYRFEEGNAFFPDSYFASVYATDFVGVGDTYWIKAFKNGEFLNKPSEIALAYDASFTASGSVDGIPFIQPIRDAINPFDQDEDDELLPSYMPGDSVYVEIHSITHETFTFFNELIVQTNRPGGFGELFAEPLANVPTNITRSDEAATGPAAVGFFNVAAVSGAGKWLDPEDLPVQ